MGLIKAALGAAGGVLADQWKEFFYCDALDKDTLMVKGQKKTSSRSSNTKGEDNIISNGSGIAVADGQAMIIVEQGKIVEFCAEPGEFTWNASTEPSIFTGSLGDSIKETFKAIGKRFTMGGDTGKDQRVYYFNTKEISGNKYGTANPVPFRVVVNEELGFKLSVDIRCNGEYSYKLTDPMLFYTNVCGNVADRFDRSEIDSILKAELLNSLQPALAKLSAKGVQYYEIPAHTFDICDALNEVLARDWGQKRGLSVFSFNVNSLTSPDEQKKKITEWEENAMTMNPLAAGARLVGAQAEAMKTAATNENGAMQGFMGMGMAMNQGGVNAQNLFAMGQQQPAPAAPAANEWKCACGATAKGKFCPECGAKKPEPKAGAWKCACGA
ncbi:MAG: SPFH domain-containing protein, partial [Clostridia bacterium]|nr:SPFH domain-containing protein [Clostridia bacterium]